MPGTAKKLMAMSDQQIEDWRRVVENMLFSSGSVTEALRLDAQHAFAQLMQELENSKDGTYYSSGYKTGWRNAMGTAHRVLTEVEAMIIRDDARRGIRDED